MNDGLVWLLVFLLAAALIPALLSIWLLAFALYRGAVERACDRLTQRPATCSVVGLVILVPLVGILVGGHAQGGASLLCGLAVMLLIGTALFGSAGLALKIGAGLVSPADAAQPWRRVVRGGLPLLFASVIPGLGWFIIGPLILASGFGAMVLARWIRPRAGDRVGPTSANGGAPAL